MNWEAIGAIGEIVGGVGVIISLLYLATQIRRDTRAKRAATIHEQSQDASVFLNTVATNTELADVFFRGTQDFNCLKGSELPRFSALLTSLFRFYEDLYFQWIDGNLDRRIWDGQAATLADVLSLPGVQAWWPTRSHWFNAEFQAMIQKKISEAGVQTMYGQRAIQQEDAEDR